MRACHLEHSPPGSLLFGSHPNAWCPPLFFSCAVWFCGASFQVAREATLSRFLLMLYYG
jgi:hypothetical protein